MISFFSLPSSDQSYYYLGQIFGNIGTVLQTPNSKLLLGIMFKSLNTTALILGAILVTHTTIVGLLKTAHEGEFLGKQWSSMWVPVRMVLGIASLFPTAAGYSALQIVMMWFIIQGVGAADSLWTVVLNYVTVAGSPYASLAIPTGAVINQTLETVFEEMSCVASAKQSYPDTYTDSSGNSHSLYYCGDPTHANENFCKQPPITTAVQNATDQCYHANGVITCNMGPNAACGTFSFGDYSSLSCPASTQDMSGQLKCLAYKTQAAALVQVLGLLDSAAQDIALYDYQYQHFRNDYVSPVSPPPAPPEFVKNFCALNNIATNACCVLNGTPTGVLSKLYSDSPCAKSNSTVFPPSSMTNGAYIDWGNTSPQAMTQVLFPCAIAPILAGQPTNACMQSVTNASDFISTAVTYYTSYISTQVGNLLSELVSSGAAASSNSFEATAQQQGWITAGAYYYDIASMNNNNLKSITPPFTAAGTSPAADPNNTLAIYRNNYNAAGSLLSTIASQTADSTSLMNQNPTLQSVSSSLNGFSGAISSLFMNAMSGGGPGGTATNPLVSLATLGESMIIAAQAIYVALVITSVLLLTTGSINVMALGTGLTSEPGEGGIAFIIYTFVVICYALMGWLISVGGLLGIYTPLVPYIIFTFGAIGWIMAVIESMIAAPFIALGILSPGGQHELLGRADQGLMILFNIFLRPTLMIMGMMVAMLLAPVVITLINSGFQAVMGSINSNAAIVETVIFMSAYASLVLSALNKSFALIHLVPDRVLSWIGHQHHGIAGSDGSDATGAAKGATGEMAASAGGKAKDTLSGLGGYMKQGGKDAKKQGAADAAGAVAQAAQNVKNDQKGGGGDGGGGGGGGDYSGQGGGGA